MYPLYFEIYLIGRTNRLNPVHSLRSDFILRSLCIRFNKSYYFFWGGGGGPRKENENVTAANRTAIDIATTIAVN